MAKISTVDNEFIHIIVSGEVEFRRESDELCLFTLQGQCILDSLPFLSFVPYVWLVRSNTVVRSIPKSVFSQLMTEKGLWPELTKVLAGISVS